MPPFAPELSAKARTGLEQHARRSPHRHAGDRHRTEGRAAEVRRQVERIATHTVFWSAGVQASPLAKILAEKTGGELDRGGRIRVARRSDAGGSSRGLRHRRHGALCRCRRESRCPGSPPWPCSRGHYAAPTDRCSLAEAGCPPFAYRDFGTMATIGRMKAVCDIFGWRYRRTAGLVHLALRAPDADRAVRKPLAGAATMGLALHDAQPLGPVDYGNRRKSRLKIRIGWSSGFSLRSCRVKSPIATVDSSTQDSSHHDRQTAQAEA